jgi:hypothetical protein
MDHGLEAHVPLHEHRGGQDAHAALGAGGVEQAHGPHPDRLEIPRHPDQVVGLPSARRQGLDAHGKAAVGEHGPPPGAVCQRHGLDAGWWVHHGPGEDGGRATGLDGRDLVSEATDVIRRGAAAPTHETRARLDEAPRIAGHVLGAREIDLAVADLAGHTGIGLRGERPVRDRGHALDRVEHGRRTDRAVESDHVGAEVREPARQRLHIGAVGGGAGLADRHLGDHGERAPGPDGAQCRGQFIDVGERLEDETVHGAGQKSIDLAPEERLRLLAGGGSERLDADAERPDGADHAPPLAGGVARQPRRRGVDDLRVRVEPEARQLHRIGTEGVGLQDVGAGRGIRFVDLADQVGLGDVELVVAHVDEHAPPVEHGAHRTVHDVDASVGNPVREWSRHRAAPGS